MIIFVDIDETICNNTSKKDYSHATPNIKNIERINKLYKQGHYIVYWTARGALTNKDWLLVTKRQFDEWGVKYNELRLDKPFYDVFIDDKTLSQVQDIDVWLKKQLLSI